MSRARLFYSDEAVRFGIPEAVLINYLRLFLRGNKQRGNNVDDDGRVWMYTTYEQIAEEHEFWNTDQVGYIVRKLRDAGVIRAERRGYDGMTWFSFEDGRLLENFCDVGEKVQPPQGKSSASTIYTEVVLKNTEGKTIADLPEEEVFSYFAEWGFKDEECRRMTRAFIDYNSDGKVDAWKKRAATWKNRAIDYGSVKAPVGPFEEHQVRDEQLGTIDTSRWKKTERGYFRR